MIVLHSPDGIAQTGLCVSPPEKKCQKTGPRRSTRHFLQMHLEGKTYEIAAIPSILAVTQPYFSATQP
jgi:hypothetical protein